MIAPGSTVVAVPDPGDRDDLRTLLRRLLRIDEAAVVRFTDAGELTLRLWSRTPFGAIVSRRVTGTVSGGDLVCGADALLTGLDVLPRGDRDGHVDPGLTITSAWSGLLPPTEGFTPVEDIPAQVLLDLDTAGREVAREGAGPAGLPPSLLDRVVLTAGADTDCPAEVDMRAVFSLVACDFVPSRQGRTPEGEPVRVSVRGPWVRLDARYGTVYRRPESLPLSPVS